MTVLRKNGLWLIIAAMAGIAAAWLIYGARPHPYLSTAQVDVEPNPTVVGTPVQPNMATEQQVATSGVVQARTARALGVTPGSLVGHLSATVSGTANVLSIGCTMPAREQAQDCSQAAAAAYIGFRNLPAGTAYQRAHDPVHVTLVTAATLPAAPAGPGKGVLLPLGALLGLAVGIGAIFVRDHFDDRVRDRADLERCLDAPVLAGVPRVRRRVVDPAFVLCRAPHSKAAEAYRYLRSRLRPLISPGSDGGTVLLVASPHSLDGRTCVAANSARALAQAGASVILVDADLRHPSRSGIFGAHPSLSEVFGAAQRPGLTDLLAGTASLEEVAVPTEVPGLRFVAVGRVADGAADVSVVARLTGIFADMKVAADVVVVDTAPVLAVSDAMTLACVSDLVVMVADVRRTARRAISAAAQEIRAAGPQIIVGVLNNEPPLANGRARSRAERDVESPAPSHSVLAALAGIVPAGGANGHRQAQLDVTATRPHRLTDTGADPDDSPGAGPASG